MVMFLSGFMFGTTAILLFYHKEPVLDIQLGTETKAGIVLAVGVLCGLMTMLLSAMGLLLSGLQLGALLSLVTLVVIGQFHNLTPVWVPLTAILVVSVITATLSLMWQKLFIVVFTSVFGATTVMLSVDYLQGAFMLPDQVYDMLCQVTPPPLCWFNWVIIGICPVLSILGMLVQWRFTAKGVSHTEGMFNSICILPMHSSAGCFHDKFAIQSKKQTIPTVILYYIYYVIFPSSLPFVCFPIAAHKKLTKKLDKRHRYRESRGRSRPHRRRRPPPLKRYTGDVLAPVST